MTRKFFVGALACFFMSVTAACASAPDEGTDSASETEDMALDSDELSSNKRPAKPPVRCPQIACTQGSIPVDTVGDACPDTCRPRVCPAIALVCGKGSEAVDTNGDGCVDACRARGCPVVDCMPGFVPSDSDGDGCFNRCRPLVCPQIACPADRRAVDTNGDGCIDACRPL